MNLALLNLALLSLMSMVTAQRASIGFPSNGASISAGSDITVELDRANSLSSSQEVAVVIGINSCRNTVCPEAGAVLGPILYSGSFKPEYHSNAPYWKPPHQNFTVTIPSTIPKGAAQLQVFHISLIGAGPAPFSEILNITVKVD